VPHARMADSDPFCGRTVQELVDEAAADPWLAGALAAYRFAAIRVAGRRVLDVGCEYGLGTYLLALEAAEVVALDSSPRALRVARGLLAHCHNVRFLVSRVERVSARDPFDIVCAFNLLHLVPEPDDALSVVRALVAPHGEALFTFPEREEVLSAKLASCFPRVSCRSLSRGERLGGRPCRVWVASGVEHACTDFGHARKESTAPRL